MMNSYQALKSHHGETKEFNIIMNVAEYKRLIKTCDNVTRYKGNNAIEFNQDSNVDWIEVELELENQSYFGCGFLKFDFELKNEAISYNSNIDGLGDYDTVTIKCVRGSN